MSMMPPMIPGAIASVAQLGPIDALLATFNTNPYFIGLMMIILNLGGRFLAMEITKGQEQFLSHPAVRRVLIFVVLFIATRNIVIAFWLWLIIVLSLGYLFNENSALCVLGRGGRAGSTCATRPENAPPRPTDQEINIFKMLQEKVTKYEAFENMGDAMASDASIANAGATGISSNDIAKIKAKDTGDNNILTKAAGGGTNAQSEIFKAVFKDDLKNIENPMSGF
jgi:hypothetical protein